MKTTKVILVAAIMAFATMGFSQSKTSLPTIQQVPQFSAVISLQSAMQNPSLVRVMHAQLSPAFLQVEKPSYIVTVKLNRSTINVFGTYKQWKKFFSIAPMTTNQKS